MLFKEGDRFYASKLKEKSIYGQGGFCGVFNYITAHCSFIYFFYWYIFTRKIGVGMLLFPLCQLLYKVLSLPCVHSTENCLYSSHTQTHMLIKRVYVCILHYDYYFLLIQSRLLKTGQVCLCCEEIVRASYLLYHHIRNDMAALHGSTRCQPLV